MVDDQLLSASETAELLQPHMPCSNARRWLELDRNSFPSISYFILDGEIFYRKAEVISFIRRFLMPSGLYKIYENRGRGSPRGDKRSGGDRRDRFTLRGIGGPDRRQGGGRRDRD